MKLVLDPAQSMLASTARDFASQQEPVERLRALRDANDELGYTPKVWAGMADLGWTGIPFAEDDGGLGMGLAEAVLITEEMGRGLAPEPFISAVGFAGSLLAEVATAEQKSAWLAGTIDGSRRLAVAHQEAKSRFHPAHCTTLASPNGADGEWVLSGNKAHVIDGYSADAWIVSARTAGDANDYNGITLFLVPQDHAGVTCTRQQRLDARNSALLDLDGVVVTAGDVLGEVGGGLAPLERAIDRATVLLCGEMLGIMRESFERTIEYLKTREQFGTKIGTFQALQHRAAEMFVEIELAKSVVMSAARAVDQGRTDAVEQVCNAKARCSDAVILVTNEALQMHGGVGMTDEYDVGLFMKRARVCELTFGDAGYQRDRFARSRGW